MARGWQLQDILGIGNLTGDPDPIWGSLSGQNAIKDATKAQQAALEKAFQAIQEYTGKGIDQQLPYTQNAGPDFQRLRSLVQGGYFQQPYGQSFRPQQYAPSGFSINPAQGMASFRPQSFALNSYTPQGLPPMPNMPAYQAPPAQAYPQQQPQAQSQPMRPPTSLPDILSRLPVPNAAPQVQAGLPGGQAPNPQTGQNSPLTGIGAKPIDPRNPTLQDLLTLMLQSRIGSSGPYGMQRGGLV